MANIYTPVELHHRQSRPVVRTFAELNQQITIAAANSRALFVELGCDIYIDKPIVLPSTLTGFHIDGGGKNGIYLTAACSSVFDVRYTSPYRALILELNGLVIGGSYTATALVANLGSSSVAVLALLSNITINCAMTYLTGQSNLTLQYSQFSNIISNNSTNLELIGAARVNNSTFLNIAGNLTLAISNSNTNQNTFVGITFDSIANTYSPVAYSYYIGVVGSPLTYASKDIVLAEDAYMQKLNLFSMVWRKTSVTLSADNQAVSTTGVTYIELTSDNATSTNRTFTLSGTPVAGQELILSLVSNGNAAELLDGSGSGTGIVRLASNMTFTADDTLTLIHNGSVWLEKCRSSN